MKIALSEIYKAIKEQEVPINFNNTIHSLEYCKTEIEFKDKDYMKTSEFKVELEINGVGYRAQKQGNKLVMSLGYSHPVEMEAPAGISFDLTDANHIVVRGIDKELVGQTANEVRAKRPPEVYRGKGIKYATEHIRRKEGKAGKK